jgi:cytochrome b561
MPLLNGPRGYGLVTKVLHWLTVALVAAQFTVGYAMSDDDAASRPNCRIDHSGHQGDAQRDRLDRLEEACESRAEAAEERADEPVATAFEDLTGGDLLVGGVALPEWHVLLGLGIIAVALARLLWRRTTPLPPWAPALTPTGRRVEGGIEKVLLTLLFVVPATGLLLVAGEDDWLPVHLTAHLTFFAALAVHLGLVLWHTVVRRDRHLLRML